MSADNYYLIRKHPGGKFVSLMGFMSDDDEPQVDPKQTYTFFSTPEKALEFVSTFGAVTEYGVRIHPECYPGYAPEKTQVTVDAEDFRRVLLTWQTPRDDEDLEAWARLYVAFFTPRLEALK